MKKVLLVYGSPRAGANTDTMVEAAASAIEAKGGQVIRFHLRDKKVGPCLGCLSCRQPGANGCIQKDDFSAILELMNECDAVILSSPVYFSYVTAQTKALIDRFYCVPWSDTAFGSDTATKKLGIILTAGGASEEDMQKLAEQVAGYFVKRGITKSKSAVARNCRNKEDCAGAPESLARAKALGEWAIE